MTDERFEREAILIGEEALNILNSSCVALFGVGGVGSYAAEALARCGVGRVVLVDNDTVSRTNINRQLCALESTVGRLKVSVTAERLRDINPRIDVIERTQFVLPENVHEFDFSRFDYVIDAIDTVSGKLAIAEEAKRAGVPMISCMGTGNKLDPMALTVTDISKTDTCPLARVMRRELKKRGIDHLKVVYSKEPAIKPIKETNDTNETKRAVPASIAFVPSVAGLIAASEAVKTLIAKGEPNG